MARTRQQPSRAAAVLLGMAAAVLTAGGTSGQALDAAARDTARAVLERGLVAMGGARLFESRFMVEGRGWFDLGVRLQGTRAFVPERTPVEERLVVEEGGSRLVYESMGRVNPDAEEWIRYDFGHAGMTIVDLLSRRAFRGGMEEAVRQRPRYERTLPHALLAEALAAGERIRYAGERAGRDGSRQSVLYETADGDSLVLLFDPVTTLLSEVDYSVELPVRGRTRVRWDYDAYRTFAGGLRYPGGYRILLDGEPLRQVTWERAVQGAATDLLTVPADIALPPPASPSSAPASGAAGEPQEPEVRDLAPGVHLVPNVRGGFHVLFVEFRDFVLAVDAPASWFELQQLPAADWAGTPHPTAVGERMVRAIRSRVGEKPIRYAVLTHHHGDHTGGVAALVAAGATVLATPETRPVVLRALGSADSTVSGEAAARFEVVDRERRIADDSMEVRLIDVGTNPHADGMLVVWLPRQRILYVSDLFEPSNSRFFPSPARLPVMRWFVDWLDRSGLEPEQIYAIHGSGRVTPEQLSRIRALRNERGPAPLTGQAAAELRLPLAAAARRAR